MWRPPRRYEIPPALVLQLEKFPLLAQGCPQLDRAEVGRLIRPTITEEKGFHRFGTEEIDGFLFHRVGRFSRIRRDNRAATT